MSDAAVEAPSRPLAARRDGEVLTIDVGGTWVRVAHWAPERGPGEVVRVRTPSRTNEPDANRDDLVERLVGVIADAVPPDSEQTVALSLGATLDHRRGVVYGSGPLWGATTDEVALAARLHSRRPRARWVVVNDVTAMLAAYRAATPELSGSTIAVVTVSSGIAARTDLPETGDIPTDPAGLQGEIGHLPALTQALHLRCACGEVDHVASFSSGPGLREVARALGIGPPAVPLASQREGEPPNAFESWTIRALRDSDGDARRLLEFAVQPLADVLSYWLTIQPALDRLVLTGGVIDAIGPHYRAALLARMSSRGVHLTARRHPEWLSTLVTLAGSPAETSPLVGAALIAYRQERRRAA